MGALTGQTVILTGAAGGLGRSLATSLSAAGADLFLTDRRADELDAAVDSVTGPVAGTVADLTDPLAPTAIVAAAREHFGRPTVLVNNAAYGDSRGDGAVLEADDDIWHRTLEVNLHAPMRLVRAVLPDMIAAGGGSVVNMSSGAGLAGDLGRSAYSASKAALISLTRNVATQYGKQGVRANAICPGLLVHGDLQSLLPPQFMDAIQDSVLAPRPGEAADVDGLVTFLAGPESAFVNGQVISVDGGLSAQAATVASMRRLTN